MQNCSAVEAVRATSAAPLFFEPIEISRLHSGSTATFIDGGLRVNNPIWEMLSEAEHIWPSREIGCLLSIGTGVALAQGFELSKNSLHEVLERCTKIATDADEKARQFHESKEGRKLKAGGKYFRFSVPQGISKDDMEKFARMPYMEAIAESYIRDQALDIERCAKELANPTALHQYMQRGYLQDARAKGLSSKDVHQRLEDALAQFTQALKALRTQGNGNAEEFHHVYKKLMDTEEGLSYSHLIPLQSRLEHLDEAQQWGARAREMARQTGKQSMLAQTEHLLVCLKARGIELEARKSPPSGPLLSRRDMILQELLEKMQNIRSNPPKDGRRLQEFERQTDLWRGRIRNGLKFNCS
ncbi:MAG: hypothetical protein Q9165_003359 [Trypethelium subeluteriae]